MRFQFPWSLTRRISNTAIQHAQEYGKRRGWRTVRFLEADSGPGKVGMKSPYKRLIYQNYGTKPRVMWELEGKLIPMKTGMRRAVGVGTPGTVTLPGGVKVFRQQRWRHPGVKPTFFMNNAVEYALDHHKQEMKRWMIAVIDPRPTSSVVATKIDLTEARRVA